MSLLRVLQRRRQKRTPELAFSADPRADSAVPKDVLAYKTGLQLANSHYTVTKAAPGGCLADGFFRDFRTTREPVGNGLRMYAQLSQL